MLLRRTLLAGALTLLSLACAEKPGPSEALPLPTLEDKIAELLSRMSLEEKVGQMAQVERGSLSTDQDIITYKLGSLLSGGGSAPASNDPQSWADMYDMYQSLALQTRLGIPLLYGIDAVHGHNNVRGAVVFPHNIGMGCTRDPELVRRAAEITAAEVAGTGIDWTFSPCIAVPRDERWGRTYEGFGETPDIAVMMAAAGVRGYQGDELGGNASILACAKHYVGDGGTYGGHDQGNTVIDEVGLRGIHLPGYRAAVDAGVGSIMASFSSWNGEKLHGHAYLLTQVLKGELGFDGFVISDWGGIDQLPGTYPQQIQMAVNAGIDMVMIPSRYQEFIPALVRLVNEGFVSKERIDDAVRRILRAKFRLGLFDRPLTDRSLTATVGSAEHRQVARECARASVVLLKNSNAVLPLSTTASRIHVAGRKADDIGIQCGGWTITWQGSAGETTIGTTILEAVRAAVEAGTPVTHDADGNGAVGASAAIVVVGENPYAEGAGDDADLSLSDEDLALLEKVRTAQVPTVVILLSGRPMIIEQALGSSDAFLAAWLPGTEGGGIADVLFGVYAPTGTLSHSWPRTMSQVPLNEGDIPYDPLFPLGYGLTYD